MASKVGGLEKRAAEFTRISSGEHNAAAFAFHSAHGSSGGAMGGVVESIGIPGSFNVTAGSLPCAATFSFSDVAGVSGYEFRTKPTLESTWSDWITLDVDKIARSPRILSNTITDFQVRSRSGSLVSETTPTKIVTTLKYALVWLIAGQSNADGYAPVSQDPAKTNVLNAVATIVAPRTTSNDSLKITNQGTGSFQTAQLGNNTSSHTHTMASFGIPNPTKSFGPEVGILDAIIAGDLPAVGGSVGVYVIKCTEGGTALDTWRIGGANYATFETVLRAALGNLLSNNFTVFIQNEIWFQGEKDGNDGTTSDYNTRLAIYAALHRDQLNLQTMPYAIGEIIALGGAMDTIRTKQAAFVASDLRTFLIDNYPSRNSIGDDIHMDAPGMIACGSDWYLGGQNFSSRADGIVDNLIFTRFYPAFENPVATQVDGVSLSFGLTVTENCTVYWGRYTSGSPTPTAANIKAGTGTGHLAHSSASFTKDVADAIVIGSLSDGTPYDFYFVAEISGGYQSRVHSVSATPVQLPGTISDLAKTANDDVSVTVTFSAAAHAVTHQEQHRIGVGAWSSPATIVSGGTISGLTHASAYEVQVRGVNVDGSGAWSNSLSFTTDFYDEFNRADDVLTANGDWTRTTGASSAFSIVTNAVHVTLQQNTVTVCPNLGSINAWASAKWKTTTAKDAFFLALAPASQQNMIGVRKGTASGKWDLVKIVGGVLTILGTDSNAAALNDVLRIERRSSDGFARLLVNGSERVTWTATDATLTNTRAGIVNRNGTTAGGAPLLDEFKHGLL